MPLARKIKMSKTRIEQKFEELKATGKSAFIPYITAGDPSLKDTKDIVFRLEAAGCDIIELGIPFSDPLADGVANQLAAERGLASGTTLNGVLDMVAEIRERLKIQLYSPVEWVASVQAMHAQGIEVLIECGPGKVLTGLTRRIEKTMQAYAIFDIASLDQVRSSTI